MSIKILWVCGKHRGRTRQGHAAWDLQGIFDTERAAEQACRDRADFIGPVPLNQPLPQEPTDWQGVRYPLA